MLERLRAAFRETETPQPAPPDDVPEVEEDVDIDRENEVDEKPWVEKIAKRKRKTPVTALQSKQNVLEWLKAYDGQELDVVEIAKVLGYKTETHVYHVLRQLMDEGYIRRSGKKYHYRYRVLRKRYVGGVTEKVVRPTPPVEKTTPARGNYKRGQYKMGENTLKVLRYIERHDGELFPLSDIAQATGVVIGSCSHHVKRLEDRGLIERSLPTKDGTRYRVKKPEAPVGGMGPNQSPASVPKAASPNGDKLAGILEEFACEFVKETWSTNLFQFLKWMRQKRN